jgi:1-aminocyclopropane-1-carboxylate deaminase
MQSFDAGEIKVDEIFLPILEKQNIHLFVLRLDKLDPVISGNKWFKLKYYLQDAIHQNKQTILTFGGYWSNHIPATAAAAKLFNFHSVGLIRGEEPHQLSFNLRTALEFGMELQFIARGEFDKEKLAKIYSGNGVVYNIPQGGYGELGKKGAAEILNFCDPSRYSHICCACGTTTMMAGLIQASGPGQQVIGVSVFKNNFSLETELLQLLSEEEMKKDFEIFHDEDSPGYGQYDPTLIGFMNEFYEQTGIPTDFVYTAMLLRSILKKISFGKFPSGSKLLIIHSGGLLGNNSLPPGTLRF